MSKSAVMGPIQRMMSLGEVISSNVKRADGWINILTGLGVKNKDPRTGMRFSWIPFVESEAEHLEGCDPVAKKVIHWIPREGTRKWIQIRMLADKDPKAAKDVMADLERLQAQARFRKAWAWARQYGGAGIFIAVDDGKDLFEPLDLSSIRKVNALTVLNRYELNPQQINTDLGDPNFGEPELYSLTPRQTSTRSIEMVHHTRIIKFMGAPLGRTLKQINNHWGDSILNAMLNSLRNYNLAHDSATAAVNDFRVGVLKLKGLAQLVASDKDDKVMDRINLMQMSKSVLSAVVLDADSESFEQRDTKLAGLKDVLGAISRRLVADTDMPHTVILGEGTGPKLGGGGNESEDRMLGKFVNGSQEEHLTDPVNRIIEISQSARQGPTGGKILEDLTWGFVPLWEPTDKDKADVHKIQSEADNTYWQIGAVDSEEIRKSRFGTEEFNTETTIDPDKDVDTPSNQTSKAVAPSETVQENVDNGLPEAENTHDHFDFILGTGMVKTIAFEQSSHKHERQNGKLTGPVVELPDGGHIHELTPGEFTGINVPIDGGDRPKSRSVASDAQQFDTIRKIEGKYFIFSESTQRRLGGPFDTKAAAEKRLREIEAFKKRDLKHTKKKKEE